MDKNRYEVVIGDNTYTIKTNRTKEDTDKIVDYVNEEIEKADQSIRYKNPSFSATLACLNIADRLFSSNEDFDNLQKSQNIPKEENERLKQENESLRQDLDSSQDKFERLEQDLEAKKEELQALMSEKEKYRLELERRVREFEKSDSEIQKLRDQLLEQEKETLQVYKMLQEAKR